MISEQIPLWPVGTLPAWSLSLGCELLSNLHFVELLDIGDIHIEDRSNLKYAQTKGERQVSLCESSNAKRVSVLCPFLPKQSPSEKSCFCPCRPLLTLLVVVRPHPRPSPE